MIEKTNKINKIINEMTWDKITTIASSVLTAILFLFGYAISFTAIRDFAVQVGGISDGPLSYLYPFLIDGVITAAVLQLLWGETVAGLTPWQQLKPTVAIIVFTIFSVGLNAWHVSDRGILAMVVAGVPPIVVLGASEILRTQRQQIFKRNNKLKSIQKLEEQQVELEKYVNDLSQTKNSMSTAQQEFEKFKQFTNNEKANIEEAIKLLETQKNKLEQHNKILNNEADILKEAKEKVKSWFTDISDSKATNATNRKNTKQRRRALVNEFAKDYGYKLISLDQDMKFIENKINSNGKF